MSEILVWSDHLIPANFMQRGEADFLHDTSVLWLPQDQPKTFLCASISATDHLSALPLYSIPGSEPCHDGRQSIRTIQEKVSRSRLWKWRWSFAVPNMSEDGHERQLFLLPGLLQEELGLFTYPLPTRASGWQISCCRTNIRPYTKQRKARHKMVSSTKSPLQGLSLNPIQLPALTILSRHIPSPALSDLFIHFLQNAPSPSR